MPFYSAQVSYVMTTGTPEDVVMNTYHFSGSNAGTDVVAITTLLEDLSDSLIGLFSSSVAQTGHSIKIINMDDTPPRYPISETSFALSSVPGGDPLPHEVALCASFQAVRQSGIPQARRRGRVYIGPLDAAAVTTTGYVNSIQYNALNTAFDNFHAAAAASAVIWSVYSTVDQDMYEVDNGWVDNAFDTQRRRGVDPTVRVTWS